ncbi:hypothetical protein KY335_05200 [Candidatus Woesearchaeota archaeon]|nr:hypothetical protein [Candidatus Woesearchaeota archaeon]
MTEGNPTESKPYVSMKCTYQQGFLVYDLLGYRISNSEKKHIETSFPFALEKHRGDLLKAMCELYAYNILNIRRLENPNVDPRYKRTGTYDVAMIRFWEKVKEAELIEKFQQGFTLSYLHYVMFTVNPTLEEAAREEERVDEETIWNSSDTGECPPQEFGSFGNDLDEGW